eukprot:6181146-Pleurochrysis_carterae.AAC.3
MSRNLGKSHFSESELQAESEYKSRSVLSYALSRKERAFIKALSQRQSQQSEIGEESKKYAMQRKRELQTQWESKS